MEEGRKFLSFTGSLLCFLAAASLLFSCISAGRQSYQMLLRLLVSDAVEAQADVLE